MTDKTHFWFKMLIYALGTLCMALAALPAFDARGICGAVGATLVATFGFLDRTASKITGAATSAAVTALDTAAEGVVSLGTQALTLPVTSAVEEISSRVAGTTANAAPKATEIISMIDDLRSRLEGTPGLTGVSKQGGDTQ